MSDERKLAVLRAIVEDYVSSREPVGSKGLVDRYDLGVSSATVRNDMALLEDEGYIVQPHTSAGRIPTDKGYLLFVDRLARIRPTTPAQRRAIQTFLDPAVDWTTSWSGPCGCWRSSRSKLPWSSTRHWVARSCGTWNLS